MLVVGSVGTGVAFVLRTRLVKNLGVVVEAALDA